MIYRCFFCKKLKLGNYEDFIFRAKNENDIPQDYKEKICKSCGDEIEQYGVLDDGIEIRDFDETH